MGTNGTRSLHFSTQLFVYFLVFYNKNILFLVYCIREMFSVQWCVKIFGTIPTLSHYETLLLYFIYIFLMHLWVVTTFSYIWVHWTLSESTVLRRSKWPCKEGTSGPKELKSDQMCCIVIFGIPCVWVTLYKRKNSEHSIVYTHNTIINVIYLLALSLHDYRDIKFWTFFRTTEHIQEIPLKILGSIENYVCLLSLCVFPSFEGRLCETSYHHMCL